MMAVMLLTLGCMASKKGQTLPQCVLDKIEIIKNQPVQNPPSEFYKWDADGEVFYYLIASCCDQFSYVYDQNCDIVCAPSGGLTGRGDGNCPDFGQNVQRTLIWKDERK